MSENFIWTGICEDNKSDPLKLGRIKVRVFGLHTDKRKNAKYEGILTKDLPWASPVLTSGSIDGISDFSVPEQGSTVIVSFLDSDKQQIVYFGSIPKISRKLPDFTEGFSDPNKQHPKSDYLNESSISRLARNEKIEKTLIQKKLDDLELNISSNKTSFSEPISKYAAEYPDNKVIETKSGHVIEIDDTSGAERINVWHKSGSFVEIYPDGSLVQKIQKTKTYITIKDDNILIKGNKNIRIFGTENVQIDGSKNIKVQGDINLESESKINISANSNIEIDGGSGGLNGVVTGSHICHYTGSPHGDKSSTVKVSK